VQVLRSCRPDVIERVLKAGRASTGSEDDLACIRVLMSITEDNQNNNDNDGDNNEDADHNTHDQT